MDTVQCTYIGDFVGSTAQVLEVRVVRIRDPQQRGEILVIVSYPLHL